MNLRALRYFVSVAQIGSITKASQVLNVAQPALSRQIRQLEQELDVSLLKRHARGIELTDGGTMLLERAQSIINMLQRTTEDLKSKPAVAAGRLSLGVPPATGLLLTPDLVRRFRTDVPQISLHIKEGVGSSLVEWVLDKRLDLAVVHNPPQHPDLRIEPLVTERMVLVLPMPEVKPNWQLPKGGEVTLREIACLPLILPSLPHTNRLLLDSVTARGGEYLHPVIEVDSVAITKLMVAQGLGATILTYAAVHGEVENATLQTVAIERPPLISRLSVACSNTHPNPAKLNLTTEIIRSTIAELIRHGVFRGALGSSRIHRTVK